MKNIGSKKCRDGSQCIAVNGTNIVRTVSMLAYKYDNDSNFARKYFEKRAK